MSPTTTHNFLSQSAGFALYALTLAAHAVSAIARALIAYTSLWLTAVLTDWPIPTNTIALIVAFTPLAASLLCVICPPLIAPIDGRWWETSTGGRPPEPDEHDAFERAFGELREADPRLRPPRHWFVAEEPGYNAAAYACSLRVDRGLLESGYAAAAIAHEMGHLRSCDARLTSALNLLLLKPMHTPRILPFWSLPFRGLIWVASGQAAMWLTDNSWGMYWRSREFAADQYAVRLGQGTMLAESLSHSSLPYERSVQRMRFSRASHPYTKPRITRLQTQPTGAHGSH